MARAKVSDFLHSFRFHVQITGFGAGGDHQLGAGGVKPDAGFNSCSTPEASHDAVEYREGHYVYTRKFVGLPSVSTVSLSRGVALTDGSFWKWMKDVIEGNAEYRANLDIFHLHRDSKPATTSNSVNTEMGINVGPSDKGFIVYKCREVFPIRHKVAGDLDSTSSEVSIQEIELAVEHFDVELHE